MSVCDLRWCLGGLPRFTVVMGLVLPAIVLARGEVTEVELAQQFATPSSYAAGDDLYRWGAGVNLTLEAFSLEGARFVHRYPAPRIVVHRVDNSLVNGESCSLFAEMDRKRLSFQPDFPGDASGTCAAGQLLRENIINRGLLDAFSNQDSGGLATAGNIERIDILFPDGILPPPDAALFDRAGFLIAEKGANSPVKVAAITAVDAAGRVAEYGDLLTINAHDMPDADALRYGVSDIALRSDFLANAHQPPNGPLVSLRSNTVEMFGATFLSLDTLGIEPGETFYGFSLFGADVEETIDLLNPAAFPLTTSRSNTPDATGNFGGDGDLYGGIGAYFTAAELLPLSGKVFRDADGSGKQNAGEDGIEGLTLHLYMDDGNGRFDAASDRLVGERNSDAGGGYRFTGLPAGRYWLDVMTDAAAFPEGYRVAGAPLPRLVEIRQGETAVVDLALFHVAGVDAALLARGDSFVAMAGQALLLQVLRNDRIPEDRDVTMIVAVPPESGSLRRVGDVFVYTPAAHATAEDGFTYTLTGEAGETSTASVRIGILQPGNGDSDLDGLPDRIDPDDDNDGIPDYIEAAADSDGDGMVDQLDLDADGDGIFDIFESSLSLDDVARVDGNADGRIDVASTSVPAVDVYTITDTDGDGIADYLDLDSDNDSIGDAIEAGFQDRDADGRADRVTGLRRPLDSDGNGIADFRQLDSDADGIFDIIEAGGVDIDGDGRIDGLGSDNGGRGPVLGDAGNRDLDADNNGIPDFQEVSGTQLRTGISGWGGGAMSWWFLPGLLISGRLMRQRKRNRIHARREGFQS